VWVNQVHGTRVIDAAQSGCLQVADASFANIANVVCVTMTADCLPVLLCDRSGSVVAAVHAGWRGLCDGVIEAAITNMAVQPPDILAWLGPAIGPQAFEVGPEVRQQFIDKEAEAEIAFSALGNKWLCDIYAIAQQRLRKAGVSQIYGGGINENFCTYTDKARFFSYRRDQITGRMASLIWLQPA
jgi:YfiH family protein